MSLAFVDQAGDHHLSGVPVGKRPADLLQRAPSLQLAIGSEKGDLDLEGGGAPLQAIVALMHPTEPIQPPLDGSTPLAPDLPALLELPLPGGRGLSRALVGRNLQPAGPSRSRELPSGSSCGSTTSATPAPEKNMFGASSP